MAKKKLKVGFFSVTSCEGCQFALLDLGEEFLELADLVDLTKMRLIEESEMGPKEKFDVAFVEGSQLLKENIKDLKDLRKRSKYLVAMGTCAHTGGIYALKKYNLGKNKAMAHVYPETHKKNFNYLAEGLSQDVEIDYILPGCPAVGKEVVRFIREMAAGKKFEIPQRPVCYECQLYQKVECLLQKGEPCLGPISLGGCDAVCPAAGMACEACRGPLEDANWPNMAKALQKIMPQKDVDEILEIFHVKEITKKKK
ncbi:hypothetical protein KKC88_05500 [Patescibacteria group bacterium]|nr:hypothetical protein [Patescibacteria group bacterium]MBU1673076.1 hypothetical protein [Patescibacteria group bacterium]MBU1963682.1 hypothetical protein [Patescibacteria group bacterium]